MTPRFKQTFFYIGIAIDIIALLVALYFIVTDNINLSSSDNTGLTILTLLFGGWIGLCFWLKSKGSPGWAAVFAWIPAAPLFLYGLVVLLFIILQPDMR